MPLIPHSISLSLLLFCLILYTLADDSIPLGRPFQDPSSSSAISFPHDLGDDSNGLDLSSGWTTAAVDLGNTGNDPIDQQDIFLSEAVAQTMVACAGPAAPSQHDGSPPNPGKKRSRLRRKRDPPETYCVVPPDYLKEDTAPPQSSSSSSSGGTTTTPNRPGREAGKTVPKAKPVQIPKTMPLLGDPNSPLCNQYFPGVGSNYAVCYYPYFKTILRTPLVHMLSPCRACKFFNIIIRQKFLSQNEEPCCWERCSKLGGRGKGWGLKHRPPPQPPPPPHQTPLRL